MTGDWRQDRVGAALLARAVESVMTTRDPGYRRIIAAIERELAQLG